MARGTARAMRRRFSRGLTAVRARYGSTTREYSMIYIEFDETGLPSYFCSAQDDLGYLLAYIPGSRTARWPWRRRNMCMAIIF